MYNPDHKGEEHYGLKPYAEHVSDQKQYEDWEQGGETADPGTPDEYGILELCQDDFPRFLKLVNHLNPRDAEMMVSYCVLRIPMHVLSVLLGKAGHRCEEDLHKAIHKMAALAYFGDVPDYSVFAPILVRNGFAKCGKHEFPLCVWQYSRSRDFHFMKRLMNDRSLRRTMVRAFKVLHLSDNQEDNLLAGWLLWLVDGSDPYGKGWKKRTNKNRQGRLGPQRYKTPDSLGAFRMSPKEFDFNLPMKAAIGGYAQGKRIENHRRLKFLLREE